MDAARAAIAEGRGAGVPLVNLRAAEEWVRRAEAQRRAQNELETAQLLDDMDRLSGAIRAARGVRAAATPGRRCSE